jgi:F0F1-type ATP synthase epsilon subunit
MLVSILESRQSVYRGNVKKVILPGEDGELCILDFHQPFLYHLRKGYIQLSEAELQPEKREAHELSQQRIWIEDGLAAMRGNELTIMIER